MSSIYLKVTIEENWRSQNFDFLRLKKFSVPSVLNELSEYIYIFTYQKTLLLKLFGLFLKSSKSFSVSPIKENSRIKQVSKQQIQAIDILEEEIRMSINLPYVEGTS